MSPKSLKEMTSAQLVERFALLAIGQYEADLNGDVSVYNDLFRQMQRVRTELKNRAGDHRRDLMPLCTHPNAQVRLMAAITILSIAPWEARRTLQHISDQQEYPQAANARGIMQSIDDGTFFPS